MQEVVERFQETSFGKSTTKPFADAAKANGEETPLLGLIVAGYGANQRYPKCSSFNSHLKVVMARFLSLQVPPGHRGTRKEKQSRAY